MRIAHASTLQLISDLIIIVKTKGQKMIRSHRHVSSLIRNKFSFVDLSADNQKKVESRQLVVSEIALSFKHDYGCRSPSVHLHRILRIPPITGSTRHEDFDKFIYLTASSSLLSLSLSLSRFTLVHSLSICAAMSFVLREIIKSPK